MFLNFYSRRESFIVFYWDWYNLLLIFIRIHKKYIYKANRCPIHRLGGRKRIGRRRRRTKRMGWCQLFSWIHRKTNSVVIISIKKNSSQNVDLNERMPNFLKPLKCNQILKKKRKFNLKFMDFKVEFYWFRYCSGLLVYVV